MSSRYAAQYAYATLPTATTSDTFASSAVNSGGLSLTAFVGQLVTIKASVACAIRASAGPTATPATASDFPLVADREYPVIITRGTAYVSVYGTGGAGTIYVAKTSGI